MYTLLVLTHYSWTLRAAETALKYLVPPVSRHWLKSGSVIEADRGVVGVAHRQPHVRRRLHTVECACSRRVGRVAAASIPTTDLRSVKCKSTVIQMYDLVQYVLSRTFLFWMTKADLGRNPLIVCCRGRHERDTEDARPLPLPFPGDNSLPLSAFLCSPLDSSPPSPGSRRP